MNIIKKILLIITILISFTFINNTSAKLIEVETNIREENLDSQEINNGVNRNIKLQNFFKEDDFLEIGENGAKGILYSIVNIAHDLKNLMYIIATIFYFIIAIKLLVSENTEEQLKKFKKGIIWITLGLMVMQMAYAYSLTLYAKEVGEQLAFNLITNIINPLIGLLEVLASIFFIAIAIFAFYRIITANGNEEETKRGRMSIVYAFIGFILIRISKVIVDGIYGKLECKNETLAGTDVSTTTCIGDAQINELSITFMQIINWMNGFIGIITIILIIYTGITILLSSGDEDKLKKARQSIIYIAIGLFILTINYLILTFFLIPEKTI